ncbi:MAG: hypothetical protein ACREA0_35495 [bacterium]
MIYPKKDQSPEQMGKDRYECHVWAVQQSGFDPSMRPRALPSARSPATPVRVRLSGPPPAA